MNDQPISTIMTKDVVVVDCLDTIEKVEAALNARGHHCVPVGDKTGGIFGIISLKDIEAFHLAKKNAKTIRAWEICTYKPVQLEPQDSVINAAKLMAEKNIDHIVVTKHKTIQGILSSLDIVKQAISQNA